MTIGILYSDERIPEPPETEFANDSVAPLCEGFVAWPSSAIRSEMCVASPSAEMLVLIHMVIPEESGVT